MGRAGGGGGVHLQKILPSSLRPYSIIITINNKHAETVMGLSDGKTIFMEDEIDSFVSFTSFLCDLHSIMPVTTMLRQTLPCPAAVAV